MSRYPNDDLFEDSRMTFGEHLEELRSSLWRAVIGIAIGMVVGLVVSFTVVQIIQDPLRRALVDYKIEKALDEALQVDPTLDKTLLRQRILDQGLVPRNNIKLDARDMLSGLKRVEPGIFGNLPAPDEIVLADEVRPETLDDLVAILTGRTDDPVDKRLQAIRRHLTPEHQARLAELPARGPASAAKSQTSDDDSTGGLGPFPGDVVIDGDAQRLVAGPLDYFTSRPTPEPRQPAALDPRRAVLATILSDLAANPALAGEPDLREAFLEDAGLAGRPAIEAELAKWKERSAPAPSPIGRRLIGFATASYLQAGELELVRVTQWEPVNVGVQALGVTEGFMIYVKTALITGLVMASPWIFWQIWQFVAVGLYPHERRYVYTYLPFSLALFIGGTMLAFFFVFKPVLDFLFSFNKALNIDPDTRISEWLSFFLLLPLGFGVAFQLPLVMLLIQRLGIITTETYLKQWRVAVLSIAVISMILTPAEPISMMLMALPLTALYFLGILMCKYMPRGRNPFDTAYEPA